MMTGHQMLLAFSACAAIAGTACGAAAQSATGAQTPEEIIRQLTPRGLPKLGTAEPNPAFSPANLPSPTSEHSSPPARPAELAAPAEYPKVTLRAITFEFGSAQLRPQSIEELHNLGIALNQVVKNETKLSIEGHTDKKGTRGYNDELSKRRADAVRDYLVKEMGISPDRLETVGKGFSDPVNPRNPYAPENRRVVVVNIAAS
jgi:outer membrane protein OmpA-like peptidoglycan-associated protein